MTMNADAFHESNIDSMDADVFYENNIDSLESYIDSFIQLIVSAYRILYKSGKKYDKNIIHEQIKKAKRAKSKLLLEDYFRNDLVRNYMNQNKQKFGLGNFIIIPGASEIKDNIELGIVDIRFESPALDDDTYFIVECKLLSHYSSAMDYYIDHGIQRFSSKQYYPDNNNNIAGMLAFMIKPRPKSKQYIITEIIGGLNKKLENHILIDTQKAISQNYFLSQKTLSDYVYDSKHSRGEYDSIDLIHIFLDYRSMVV